MHPPEYSVTILPPLLKRQAADKITRHIDWLINYAQQHPLVPPSPTRLNHKNIDWIKAAPVTGHIKLDMVINEYKGCINYMNSKDDSHLIAQFKKNCNDLDKLRKEDTAKIYPELAELFL